MSHSGTLEPQDSPDPQVLAGKLGKVGGWESPGLDPTLGLPPRGHPPQPRTPISLLCKHQRLDLVFSKACHCVFFGPQHRLWMGRGGQIRRTLHHHGLGSKVGAWGGPRTGEAGVRHGWAELKLGRGHERRPVLTQTPNLACRRATPIAPWPEPPLRFFQERCCISVRGSCSG